MATSKDVNGNTTTYDYTDPYYWRLSEVDKPSGGGSTYTYNTGSTFPWNIRTSTKQTASANITTETVLDGLGRTSQAQLTSDPEGTDYVDTTYDALGRSTQCRIRIVPAHRRQTELPTTPTMG